MTPRAWALREYQTAFYGVVLDRLQFGDRTRRGACAKCGSLLKLSLRPSFENYVFCPDCGVYTIPRYFVKCSW